MHNKPILQSMTQADITGFLRTCMDKRFVAPTRKLFEKTTGLIPTDYWHESYAGGTALPPANTIGEDYAYEHGAIIFGWQAHGDSCGGQPGIDNQTIEKRLQEIVKQKQIKFPKATHYIIFATDKEITIIKAASG